jgi:hypothetical protein
MTCEDEVFVVNGVITNSTRKTMVTSVISRPTSAIVKLNATTKIRKYKRFREGHYFIPMTMEVHETLRHDIDHFIKECACLFHDR